uniref:Putative sine oculis-related homeobox 6b n=1 Tax=Rhipicephalus pulchellus TaxID=72859 RepID=L7LZG1_RHIPC
MLYKKVQSEQRRSDVRTSESTMSKSLVFGVIVSFTLMYSALAHCVTYGYCGTEKRSGKRLPCAFTRDPVLTESSVLEDACPALIESPGKPVPACCDAQQAAAFKSEFKRLHKLGVRKDSKCFKNFENLVCQAFCSPEQSKFVAVFGSTAESEFQPSATDTVYVVEKHFAEEVYHACKDVSTRLFGMRLMSLMCGKYGAKYCTAQRFLDFVGAVYSEGGYSPLKIRHVLAETAVVVNGQRLEPFKSRIF